MNNYMKEKYIDLSHTIEDLMPVYPGDEATRLYRSSWLEKNGYNNHRLETGMHAGTHIDTPMHLTENTEYVSQLPLERFCGYGTVFNALNETVIGMKREYERLNIQNGIVLIYTGHDSRYGSDEYFSSHPVITMELAEFLVSKSIKMLGMDTPSPDRYPFPIHKYLMKNNILILENLTNLKSLLEVNQFEVLAFPLRIKADASIVRAAARVINE